MGPSQVASQIVLSYAASVISPRLLNMIEQKTGGECNMIGALVLYSQSVDTTPFQNYKTEIHPLFLTANLIYIAHQMSCTLTKNRQTGRHTFATHIQCQIPGRKWQKLASLLSQADRQGGRSLQSPGSQAGTNLGSTSFGGQGPRHFPKVQLCLPTSQAHYG